MKSIQTKFIALILGCVLLSSTVIGRAGILNAQRVVDGDSAQLMNRLCSEHACELNGLLSRIEQSVKTLAVYTVERLESVEKLNTDAGYLTEYTGQLEEVAVNAAANTLIYCKGHHEIVVSKQEIPGELPKQEQASGQAAQGAVIRRVGPQWG